MEGGAPLGINFTYLLAQLLNLIILFAALYKFLFKRFLAMLDERSARIKKGIEDAQIADKRATEAEAVYQQRIEYAERERRAILNRAAQEAEELKEGILAKAEEEARQCIAKEREEFEAQRQQAMAELSRQAVDLVMLATRKMVAQTMVDEATQRRLISEFLAELAEVGELE
ncbi:MAG: F0F1 ATP synthase subunit B [Anaerolineae bacterium]|nr:F0F1 ATP synthase subunit B [Anaerolineae bacterium]